jgi:hypothetical protein
VRAVMAAHAAQENISPIDLILAVMREPHVALGQRVKMALKALPHVHAKAKAGQPRELSDDQAKPDNGSSSAAHVNANARNRTKKVNQELMPLDFLQSVIRDAKTPAALQIKVAQAIIPLYSAKAIGPAEKAGGCRRPAWLCRRSRTRAQASQQGGATIAAQAASEPADQKLIMRLNLELVQMTAALQCPCPSRYSMLDAGHDEQRLVWLWRKRRSRKKLNAIEDATLAHINARYMAFVSGPEMQNRARLAELKEKERRFRIAFGPPLTCREQALLICLSTLCPPKKADCDPEFLADCSAFSTVDADDDGYPLEYQRAKAPPLGVARESNWAAIVR